MASSMYLCYRELLPATNIKCCCFFTLEAAHHLNSTASETQYLLVCSSSTLTIFHVLSGALQCSYSTQIYGTPRSVDAVRGASSSSSNRQSIILALDEGKIVVFEYLPSSRSLHLLLSFNAEENAFGLGAELLGETEGKVSHPGVGHIPTMAVDSSGKVAATVIYGHEILITPLCADIISPKMPPKSFILRNLRALGIERLALRDIVFLPGYASSTLAILHEVAALPIGHTFKISSTMAVTVIGIDIYRKAAYFVWKQRDLPSSSFRLHPLSFPSLSGTVLVISASAMLICGQDHVLAFAFSGFARQAVHKSIKLRPASLKIGIDLDASRWVTVADGASFLATLKTGVMLHVRLLLPIEGNWSSAQHVVEQLGITSIASSLTYSPSSNLLFIGSRESDAVLLQLELSPMNVDTIPNPKTALNAGGLSSIGTPAPPTKKARRISNKFEDSSELMASFANDETFLYGASLPIVPTETLSSASYQISFQVLDTVPVLGPVLTGIFSSGDTDIVDRSSEVDWERQAAAPLNTPSALAYIVARETKHALIVSAGMGDQASLYRVSRGLRYSKLAARNFYGCQSISALRFQDSNLHKICFLFLSFAQRTRVMRCLDAEAGDTAAMHEVIPALSGFVFVDSTVHVAMLSTDLCVQVYSSGLRVLKVSGVIDEALQDVLVEEELDLGGLGGSVGEFIVMADVCEEHVVVLTDRRNIFFLKYDFEAENLELICRGASGEEGPLSACLDAPPSSISFYKGLFEPSTGQPDDKSGKKTPSLVSEFAMEEEYFYGKVLDDEGALEVEEVTMEESEVVGMSDKLYISVCNLYGGLSIIDLESFTVTFHSAAFSNAAMRVDANHLDTTPQDLPQSCSRTLARAHLQRIHSEAHSKLCLVAVLDTYDVLVYYALEEKGAISAFLKMEHGCVTRKRSKLKSPHSDLEMKTWNRILLSDYSVNKITNDLNMACGIIVSGPNPVVISLHKGLPSVQPLGFPEIAYANTGSYLVVPVQSSGVKGVACLWQEREESASGDVKPSKEAVIGLYQEIPLQTPLSNRSSLSFKRLNVGMTVHKALEILPHSQDPTELALLKRKTLLLACSEELQLPFLPSVLTDEQFEEDINTYERFFPEMQSFAQPDHQVGPSPPLLERKHRLVLLQEGVAVDSFEQLRAGEHIMDVCVAYLTVSTDFDIMQFGAKKTQRVFVLVGTCVSDRHGEDTQGEGRLLLFTLDYAMFGKDSKVESQEENDDALAKTKMEQTAAQAKFLTTIQPKLCLTWEGPGPATIVRQVGECILSTVGPVVYMYRLSSASLELDQIAFFYAQFFIASVSIVRNYIYLADALSSVQLLVWRELDSSLTLAASDFEPFACVASACLQDGNKLSLVVADDDANAKVLHYNPSDREQGRLGWFADIHVGSVCTYLAPHRLLGAPMGGPGFMSRFSRQKNAALAKSPFSTRLDKTSSARTAVLFGSSDGCLGMLIPVEERAYRRLALLQQILSTALESPLALNPREFRDIKGRRQYHIPKRGILDGTILWRFLNLPADVQDELTGAMNTSTDLVLENLHELDMITAFF